MSKSMKMACKTLLLRQREIAALLSLEECIAAVERAFQLQGEGRLGPPGILGIPAMEGGFHIKAGLLPLEKNYFVAKVNANFPGNPERHGLPAIQGVIVLADAGNGAPLALLDSIEITLQRTAAATAVAAKYLAREDARVAMICGCGNQGRAQLRALAKVRRIERVFAFDTNSATATRFAADLSTELNIEVEAVKDLAAAVQKSEICVTCTPARSFYLRRKMVAPGTFLAAVGADNADKQELEPALFADARVVVDSFEQCAAIGDLHHALEQGVVHRCDFFAELGEVVAGRKPGRTSEEEITIFDSTGVAIEDAAAAAMVYEKAMRTGAGLQVELAG